MEALLRYRGREITEADAADIRELIARHPGDSRRGLSMRLCEAWGWVQPNGAPRDMVCRGMMLALARAGHIELPAHRKRPPNPLARRARPAPVEVDQTPLCASLRELGPLEFRQVRRTADEPLFNALLEAHHYLGYSQPVGEHLKYLVFAGGRPVACFAWSSAPRHLAPRDHYVGWSPEARRQNIRLVAYNTRFLVLPWVQVPHLASHLLGRMVRMLPAEWRRVYGHEVVFAETFIDAERFRGTCYRAANWVHLGHTTGRGKNDQTHRPNRTLKDVLGIALTRDWRERLRGPHESKQEQALEGAPSADQAPGRRDERPRDRANHRALQEQPLDRRGPRQAEGHLGDSGVPHPGAEVEADLDRAAAQDPVRLADGEDPQAGERAGDERGRAAVGRGQREARRPWTPGRRGLRRRRANQGAASDAAYRRLLPGVHQGTHLPGGRAGEARAHHWGGAAQRDRLRARPDALQPVRRGLHGAAA